MKKIITIIGITTVIMLAMVFFTKKVEEHYGIDKDKLQAEYGLEEDLSNIKKNSDKKGTKGTSNEFTVLSKDVTDSENGNNQVPQSENTGVFQLKISGKFTSDDWKKRDDNGLTGIAIDRALKDNAGLYYFEHMDASYKQLYAEIYILLSQRAEEVPLCAIDEKVIDKVFNCVLADHPEIFYVDGYSYTRHLIQNKVIRITFVGSFTYTNEEIKQAEEYLEQYYESYATGIAEDASEYDKVKYTYEFIIINTEYNLEAPENQNLMSVCGQRESVCQGYSKMFQYLLNRQGVECTFCFGKCGDEGHAWNLVKVDNAYYYVDVTWGDLSYNNSLNKNSVMSEILYDYLLVTSTQMNYNHLLEELVPMPQCVSIENNYYVKEGLYFEEYDDDRLKYAFKNALNSETKVCTIKCSDVFVFDELKEELIDKQRIFDYVGDDIQQLNYEMNESFYTYTFILE